MEIHASQFVSLEPRSGDELPTGENQLGMAIEYMTKQGCAICFYTATMKEEFFCSVDAAERPRTVKFIEQEGHVWRAVFGRHSSAEQIECDILEEEILLLLKATGTILHGKKVS